MICKKCGASVPDGSSYCNFCGKAVAQIQKKNKTRRANGEGYVFQKPGSKKWNARVLDTSRLSVDPVTGKIQMKYVQKGGFLKEKDARVWAMEYYAGIRERPSAPTLCHYWTLFENGELASLSASKQQAYRIAWGKMGAIAGQTVDRLTVSDLRRCVSSAAPTYYPARDMKTVLSHLFTLAAADRFCDKDLPSFIVLPKLEEKEQEPFTDEEVAAFWHAFESGDLTAAWPLLMIYTGLMPGETMKITIPMVDLEQLTITGAGLKTSTRKTSAVHFPDFLVPVLTSVIDGREDGKLFRRNKDNLYKDYHELTARIGVRDLSPYSCRHTAATALAINKNIAPETLRMVMRWSKNSNMIPRYVHPDDSAAAAAVRTLSRPDLNPEKGH